MKKIKDFEVDIRPIKELYGIPIPEVALNSFQMRPDGILVNGKLYIWESLLEVRIKPIFEEEK